MNRKSITFVSGAIALSMLLATPVSADSEIKVRGDGELKLGGIMRLFDKAKHEERREEKKELHASSTSDAQVSVSGTVTAVNGNTISLSGKAGAQYSVNAANATFIGHDRTITITDIKVGDTLKVHGTLSGQTIVAAKINDKSIEKRDLEVRLENLRAGIVTSVANGIVTITRFGTGTSTTINTNASTTVKVRGGATTTSSISQGDIVIALGGSAGATSTPDSITASVIHVINSGFGWLKKIFNR